jgi:hypothetical protein
MKDAYTLTLDPISKESASSLLRDHVMSLDWEKKSDLGGSGAVFFYHGAIVDDEKKPVITKKVSASFDIAVHVWCLENGDNIVIGGKVLLHGEIRTIKQDTYDEGFEDLINKFLYKYAPKHSYYIINNTERPMWEPIETLAPRDGVPSRT